jgi:hypothetical protein
MEACDFAEELHLERLSCSVREARTELDLLDDAHRYALRCAESLRIELASTSRSLTLAPLQVFEAFRATEQGMADEYNALADEMERAVREIKEREGL